MFLLCAVPRANHLIRVLPPSLSQYYANCHDYAMRRTFFQLLGIDYIDLDEDEYERVCSYMSIPSRLGGLGIRSAVRTAPAAYWAAWADAIPVMIEKQPDFAQHIVHVLNTPAFLALSNSRGLQEVESCRTLVCNEGYATCPSWDDIVAGERPPNVPEHEADVGEWQKGW